MNLDFIAAPLGHFLKFVYDTVSFHNYGIAIIIFTIIIKLALLPLTIKQYQSQGKMQQIQPMLKEAQTRYKNDKEKLNQETMKIYSENKVNPAGGCLPLLVQMPILITLYWVIIQPLKFMLGKNIDQVNKLSDIVNIKGYQREIGIINYFNQHVDKLKGISDLLKRSELVNFNFFGINLGTVPNADIKLLFGPQSGTYLPLLIIPIFAVITTYISAKLTIPKNTTQGPANSMQNTMLYIGPVMTLFFSFSLPAGVGLYWAVGYVVQIFQQLYINKNILKKKEVVIK